ncbi:MAG: acyltransferase family protein [Mycobacteriales bacterium]
MRATTPSRPGLGALASGTPQERDRFVDLLRAASILVVVLGHWLMAAVVRRGGVLRADNALAAVPWLQPLTWVFQVMPVFFVVGGFANAQALGRPGARTSLFLARRARRLLPPTLLLVAGWLMGAAVLVVAGAPDRTVRDLGSVAAQPLWFLAVYLLLVLLAPVQLRLHRRRPWLLLAVLPVAAVVLDAGRLSSGVGKGLAILNYLAVFVCAQELGFWYGDGRLLRLSRSRLVGGSLVALALLVLVTAVGPYPVSMVGVPGQEISNMSPPTVCVLLLTFAQVGLLLAARPVLLRWLERPRVWRTTIAANLVVLTVFLWHLTAYVVAAGLLRAAGRGVPSPGSTGWWLSKPVDVLLAAVVLLVLVLVCSPLERRDAGPPSAGRLGTVVAGTLLAATGLAGLAASGFSHPFTTSGRPLLGVRFSPLPAALLLVVGWLLAAGIPRPGPSRSAGSGAEERSASAHRRT